MREDEKENVVEETEGLRGVTREGINMEEREEVEMVKMRMNKKGRGREAER